jgi:hypothetical protein
MYDNWALMYNAQISKKYECVTNHVLENGRI